MTTVVGFDLDDTLVPEVLFIRSGIRHIAQVLHETYPRLPELRIVGCMDNAAMTGNNHYSALETLLHEYGLSGSVDMKCIVDRFRSHMPDPEIYHVPPSLLEILKRLRNDTNIKTVLVTDGRSLTQRNKIKSARLDRFFDEQDIHISEETGFDKTYPDTFLHIMEKYAGAREFHYIGDNPAKDFIHPARLGWHIHQVNPFPLMIHPQGMPR